MEDPVESATAASMAMTVVSTLVRRGPARIQVRVEYTVTSSLAELDLDSAELEVMDPAGADLAVDDYRLELISAGKLHRYRLAWKGPWTGLAAGDYQVKVRASDRAGVTLSSPPHRVRLVDPLESNSELDVPAR